MKLIKKERVKVKMIKREKKLRNGNMKVKMGMSIAAGGHKLEHEICSQGYTRELHLGLEFQQ